MAKKKSLLEQMRDNPRNDWQITDVQKLCHEHSVKMENPSGGSHYKIHSDYIYDILIMPAKRPIKSIYIKRLVTYIDVHLTGKFQGDDPAILKKGEDNGGL